MQAPYQVRCVDDIAVGYASGHIFAGTEYTVIEEVKIGSDDAGVILKGVPHPTISTGGWLAYRFIVLP